MPKEILMPQEFIV